MKTRIVLAAGLVLAVSALVSGQARPARGKKADPDMVTGPLIRMSLLERKEGPFAGAKRDPFIPGAISGPEQALPHFGVKTPPQAGQPGGIPIKPEAMAEGAEQPVPAVNLRYVGFIQGKEKLLALVMFNGQAVAVAAGETLGDIWKVDRVGPLEIVIQGPDGAPLKFALEGERK